MSRRTPVVGALSALLLSPLALGAPAAAQPAAQPGAPEAGTTAVRAVAARDGATALRPSQRDLIPGERITLTARAPKSRAFTRLSAPQRRTARLVLQRRVGSRWRAVASARLKRPRVTLPFTTPASARGTVALRTVAKVRGRQYRGGRVTLPVVAQQLAATTGDLVTSVPITFATSLTPVRKGRQPVVQVHRDGAWTALDATGAPESSGRTALVVQAAGHPAWYRVVAPAWNGAAAVATAPVRTTLDRVPSVVAHRAGAGTAPEQTLAALRQSLAAGVTSVEVDVQLTSDRQPVILHDSTLSRTTDVEERFPDRAPYRLSDFTLAEVQTLDAGSWFGAGFAGERIPTLDQVLAELGERTRLVLEVKAPEEPGNEQVDEVLAEQLVGGALGRLAATGRLTVSSFGHPWLQQFALAHPEVPVGVLSYALSTAELDSWLPWAEEVHPNAGLVDRAVLAQARSRGLGSSVWTVNSLDQFRAALALGADRIITDYPARLAEVLDPPRPS